MVYRHPVWRDFAAISRDIILAAHPLGWPLDICRLVGNCPQNFQRLPLPDFLTTVILIDSLRSVREDERQSFNS
jgi:hypothetical protein